MEGTSPGARYTLSESGWSTTSVFKQYMEEHFITHVRVGSEDSQPILLIVDGHSTHTSREAIQWALTKNIILFVLPAHTSHVLQPLDVGVFGPFKRYFYSECAAYMTDNLGKVVTKYEMASVACKAYLKAMTPQNIISAFRRTGIYPLRKDAVPMERLLPCEAFRDDRPILKARALKAGKEAVDEYLENKLVKQSPCTCHTAQKASSTSSKKPTTGGKEITSMAYIQDLDAYEAEKENARPNIIPDAPKVHPSPRPSTSGLFCINANNNSAQDTDMDDDDDDEPCCVCGQHSPPNLSKKPFLKIVNWAQCDKCDHWVHLGFCHSKTVIRRGDDFVCQHCF